MLCSGFISVPAHVHAFSPLLSLPRQIPGVIPSTQCNELPIRLCCHLAQSDLCNSSTPPSPASRGCFAATFGRLQGAVRSRAHHGSTHRATTTSYQRTKWSNYWNKINTADPQNSTASFQLVIPSCHSPTHVLSALSIRLFSSPVKHSPRRSLVRTAPRPYFYTSNYGVCVCAVHT